MADESTGNGHLESRRLGRRAFLKASAITGAAGLAGLSSPLGARGVALAQYSERLARQPLDTSAKISLRFMTRSSVGKRLFFKLAGDAFMKQYPNVTIVDDPHPNDWQTKLKVEMAGGNPPDLVFSSDDNLMSFAARGTHVDLLPFFKADGLKRSDFWPAALDPQFLGNHLFAMPLDYGMHVLYYNKALFDQQHQSYPTDKWTWDDFVRVGRNLTLDRSGKRASEAGFQPEHVVQYGEEGNAAYFFNDILRSNGGEWATPDLSKSLLDTPLAISTMQWIADLGAKYYVNPSPKYVTSLAIGFANGNAAMDLEGTWAFANFAFVPKLKWNQGNIAIAPLPLGSKGRGVGAEASGLVIPTGTKPENVKWAWELIKWMATEPGQRLGFKYGVDSIPNMPKLAHELIPTYKQPQNTKIILELLPQAKLPFWCEAISDTELENILQNPWSPAPELYHLFKGTTTAAQAMPVASKKVQAILDVDQALARKFGATLTL